MPNPPTVVYFLTEDLSNRKERNEIEYLRRVSRVVLVSRGSARADVAGVRQLRLPPQPPLVSRLFVIWTKLCYLLCRIADSASDIEFPSRNIYSGTPLVRSVINAVWRVKRLPWLNRLLPTYDALYFLPFRIGLAVGAARRMRQGGRFKRLVVHDSLILRLAKFTTLIAQARRSGVQTVANVKSWDNPFYSQFARAADSYLVWSRSMWEDVRGTQRIEGRRPVHVWGARPFYDFSHAVAAAQTATRPADGRLVIGYAAAFCDEIMATHEVELIRQIALALASRLPRAVISLRPYPILPLSHYAALAELPNVELVDIRGDAVDRYNDGREFIRFGSDEERLDYLARCDCFLSMATSFTMEAAVFGLPVVHYFREPKQCADVSEATFFQRIDISDHLKRYFNRELLTATTLPVLVQSIASAQAAESPARAQAQALLRRIGIPQRMSGWDEPQSSFAQELAPAGRG